VGLAVGYEDSSLLDVMRKADLAMYADKRQRKASGN
jgi:hypothetical protein